MKKTRILSLILAVLMTASSLIACSESEVSKETEKEVTGESASESATETVHPDFIPDTTYYADMEADDFGGMQFNVCGTYGEESDINSVCEYISMDTLTGDEFNDALYNRIIAVNDKYNVNIVVHDIEQVVGAVKQSVTSGTQDYQLCGDVFESLPALYLGGYAYPITSMPNIDLDLPYWDQGSRDALTVYGVMFYVLSDISFSHYDSTAVLFYNGALIEEYQIPQSPIDLFREGKWTMDNMMNMMSTVSTDKNGDGEIKTGEDIMGLVGRDLRLQPMLSASGVDVIRWDDNEQTYVVSYTDETVMKVGDLTNKLVYESGLTDFETGGLTEFKNGYALFDSHLLGNFKSLRDQEDDYGIIPWPSVEENMEIYAYCRNPTALLIPSHQKNEEELGTIMSALAAYGHDYIIDNYINRTVIGKGARDRDSADMIIYMMDKRMYDITYAFNLGTASGGWAKAVKNGSYASSEKALGKIFKSSIRQALAPFEEYAE